VLFYCSKLFRQLKRDKVQIDRTTPWSGLDVPKRLWRPMDSVLMNRRFLNAAFCGKMLKQEREGKENRDRLLQNVYSLGRFLEHRK